jgi:hypothetical protein
VGDEDWYGAQTLRIAQLCVRELPASGTTGELLHAAGIDAQTR